jgi:putative ABC transport system permease protein
MIRLAWLTIVRQPARAALAVLGVAAVGALLFDMLLLSHGLVLSFRDLLDRAGFDVRVLASDAPPFTGPPITNAAAVTAAIESLPEVESVLQLRMQEAEVVTGGAAREDARTLDFIGTSPAGLTIWTLLDGHGPEARGTADPSMVVNRNLSRTFGLTPGSRIALRGLCAGGVDALPPVTVTVSGIADFPFDRPGAWTAAGSIEDLTRLCGDGPTGEAEVLMVRSRSSAGADAAAAAIHAARPDLYVVTNEELVERFSRVEFSYFRQISAVLATVTLFFGFLLIAVLLTVSVNQRLGEIAALRALGLSRSRVTIGILLESAMLVAAGGVLAVPVGFAVSLWLDRILSAMPGVPADLHFFVYEPRALVMHAALLALAAIAAAVYPMRIVSTLPIAATLRREVVS